MTVCQFFIQGRCKFGSNCRNEHYNADDRNTRNTASTQQVNNIIRHIEGDVILAENGGQWPLSCFAPIKEGANIPGWEDISPEEVRWKMYEARANGTLNQCISEIKQLYANAEKRRNSLKQPTIERINLIVSLLKNKKELSSASAHFTSSTDTSRTDLFDRSTTSTKTQGSVFGSTDSSTPSQGSIFSGTTSTSTSSQASIFGGSTTSANSQNIFGGSVSSSCTSDSSQSSLFGGSVKSTDSRSSLFGTAIQSSDSQGTLFASAKQSTPSQKGLFNSVSSISPSYSIGSIFSGGGGGSMTNSFVVNKNVFSNSQPSDQNLFTNATPRGNRITFSGIADANKKLIANPIISQITTKNPFAQQVVNTSLFSGSNSENLLINSQSTIDNTSPSSGNIFGEIKTENVFQTQTLAHKIIDSVGSQPIPVSQYSPPRPGTPAPIDPSVYSAEEDLNEEELKAYLADTFTFGKIPSKPPPRRLCHID